MGTMWSNKKKKNSTDRFLERYNLAFTTTNQTV